MIGFYNASVILTYIGLASAVLGMIQSINNNFLPAVCCMLVCGLCDMFDGKIARAMKRSEGAKKFGIQIDSLCDLVCFGVFPAIFAYNLGVKSIVGTVVLIFYVLAAIIRLGYFNVTEEERQQQTSENRTVYQGLPVTSISLLLPLLFLLTYIKALSPTIIFTVGLFIIGLLFILDIRVNKPHGKITYLFIAFGAAIFGIYIYLLMA